MTKFYGVLAVVAFTWVGCGGKGDSNAPGGASSSVDIQEWGQQIGDVMASIDEMGNTSGFIAKGDGLMFDRFDKPTFFEKTKTALWNLGVSLGGRAYAADCAGFGFSACANGGIVVRTFGGCTVGGASFAGNVVLTWTGSTGTCLLSSVSDSIRRVPDFTITGRRGATLVVSKTGTNGQKLVWKSGPASAKVFDFSNDGIRRLYTSASGTVLFDYTTTTSSNITITGSARGSRVASGGTLKVYNNVTGVYCDATPTDVSWSSTSCNCPVSGRWTGTCSDGKNFSVWLTGCGTGRVELGQEPETESFSFDRCSAI